MSHTHHGRGADLAEHASSSEERKIHFGTPAVTWCPKCRIKHNGLICPRWRQHIVGLDSLAEAS